MREIGKSKQLKKGKTNNPLISILPVTGKEFVYFAIILILSFTLIRPWEYVIISDEQRIINTISALNISPENENPIAVDIIGGGGNLPSISEILSNNEVNAEIYRDARNGDYVVGYKSKLIIYRQSEDRVIYDGPSPEAILDAERRNLISAIIRASKEDGVLPQASNEQPRLLLLDDVFLNAIGPVGIYEKARENDIVATFYGTQIVVLFRPSETSIIDSRKIS